MLRMPPSTLYDMARNENARWEARKEAYLILLDRAHPLANHENLYQLAYMVADEVIGGEKSSPADIPESKQAETPEVPTGPFTAGFTTKNQMQDEFVNQNLPE